MSRSKYFLVRLVRLSPLWFALALGGCGHGKNSVKTSPIGEQQVDQGDEGQVADEPKTKDELEQQYKDLQQQDATEAEQLRFDQFQNAYWCRKLNQQRRECPALQSIVPSASSTELSCEADQEVDKLPHEVVVELSPSVAKKYRIVANSVFRSNVEVTGNTTRQRIQFSSAAGAQRAAPAFLEITDLKLVSSDSEDSSIEGFALYMNNQLMFTESDFIKVDDNTYELKYEAVAELAENRSCFMDDQQRQEEQQLIEQLYQEGLRKLRKETEQSQ